MANQRKPLSNAERAILRGIHEGHGIELGGDLRHRQAGEVIPSRRLDSLVSRGLLERKLGVYSATLEGLKVGKRASEEARREEEMEAGFDGWLDEMRGLPGKSRKEGE